MLTKTVCCMSFIPYLHLCIITISSLSTTYQHACLPLQSKTVRNLVKYVCVLHVSQEKLLRHNVVLFITAMTACVGFPLRNCCNVFSLSYQIIHEIMIELTIYSCN